MSHAERIMEAIKAAGLHMKPRLMPDQHWGIIERKLLSGQIEKAAQFAEMKSGKAWAEAVRKVARETL